MYFCHVLSVLFFTALLSGLYLLVQEAFIGRSRQMGLAQEFAPGSAPRPPLSVLICAHNEEVALRQNLPLILLQAYPHYEVRVGLDHCNDHSFAVVQQYARHFSHLKIQERRGKQPSKKAMQQQLIAAAAHKHLVFTDADCRPASPQWLEAYGGAFGQANLVLGVGLLRSEVAFLDRLVRWETAQTALLYQAAAFRQKAYMGVGRNMGICKSYYCPALARPELRSGDDDLLVNALSGQIKTAVLHTAPSFTYSAAPPNWGRWWRQKRRHHSTGMHYRRYQVWLLATRGLAQMLFWPATVALAFWAPWAALLLGSLRYTLTVLLQGQAFHHFQALGSLLLFPLWETLWAWSAWGMQVQNTLKPRPNEW